MIKAIRVIIAGLVTSFFLFPFNLPVNIVVNTKMILAVLGASVFLIEKATQKDSIVSKDFITLMLLTAVISLWAFGVVTINNTNDYSFALYIVSITVWLGAAFFVFWLYKKTHGNVSFILISHYLIGVCVAQCILAYAMTLSPSLNFWVDSLMGESSAFMGVAEGRIYGLGAALDVAGLRFSAILVIITWLMTKTDTYTHPWVGFLYLFSFFIISVIGNMIARTTTVGMGLGLFYLLINRLIGNRITGTKPFWTLYAPASLVILVLLVTVYQVSPSFQSNIRFGFEGFFSLIEKGRWEVRSNDLLQNMIIWPEALKTWIIGDGFFESPDYIPDRFGQVSQGFYKHTDIGYLRYIFYFGVIGLVLMMLVPIQMTVSCSRKIPEHKWLFIMLLAITFIGWLKVSSDIIMVFAPFLILAYEIDSPCTSSTT